MSWILIFFKVIIFMPSEYSRKLMEAIESRVIKLVNVLLLWRGNPNTNYGWITAANRRPTMYVRMKNSALFFIRVGRGILFYDLQKHLLSSYRMKYMNILKRLKNTTENSAQTLPVTSANCSKIHGLIPCQYIA